MTSLGPLRRCGLFNKGSCLFLICDPSHRCELDVKPVRLKFFFQGIQGRMRGRACAITHGRVHPCRMSGAAEKSAEACSRLSGEFFELSPDSRVVAMAMQPVKRLSEELANAIRSRNS